MNLTIGLKQVFRATLHIIFITHVFFIGYYTLNPEVPSIMNSKKSLIDTNFPVVFKICADEIHNEGHGNEDHNESHNDGHNEDHNEDPNENHNEDQNGDHNEDPNENHNEDQKEDHNEDQTENHNEVYKELITDIHYVRYNKVGYDDLWKFFYGKSKFDNHIYGWSGHMENGSTFESVEG